MPQRLLGRRLTVLVPYVEYGSEGIMPAEYADCPYFQEHGDEISCMSGSGGSICGGFQGTTMDSYVQCGWWPTQRTPGQLFTVSRGPRYSDTEIAKLHEKSRALEQVRQGRAVLSQAPKDA